tara:strand:+ start:340 stop:903 length:564 start_codon:yes stop_codon:yes gene_type:complete
MRLSSVEIREIVTHGGFNASSKSLVLHLDDGSRFNILLGIGRQVKFFDDCSVALGEQISAPTRHLYEAHIAIGYNVLLRNFFLVKHRFAADGTRFNSINEINRLLSQQFLNMGFGGYDVLYIISKICECISLTTGEPIFFTRNSPFGGTGYDLHINGEDSTNAKRYIGKGIDAITPCLIPIRHSFSD